MVNPETNRYENEAVIVLCNCPDAAVAMTLAHGLIEARLAACVNLLPQIQSVYRWEGRIETAAEVPLLIKTTGERYAALQTWLAGHHPYDVPEIIALPAQSVFQPYLDWLVSETLEK
ncbi:divalent-cation tolerance protein CutA [Silvimonas iriomotensis]|uniref:Divalent-cation tolerance protein CutA n=1 Tax=Silvimonas iriomotensis TaxID=449662 RepID=A0ABQ2PC67_9NEIS|nr:divalent-cation tolerance protein CutA [Silvimonas iriomotensis]GGP22822.1 divalent-cation tolerance protein CutA [Silvimonas iriomotensis]